MKLDSLIRRTKLTYIFVLLPLQVIVFIQTGSLITLIGIVAQLGFMALWLRQWERRIKLKSEFMYLDAACQQLYGAEKQHAYERMLEIAEYHVLPSEYVADAIRRACEEV